MSVNQLLNFVSIGPRNCPISRANWRRIAAMAIPSYSGTARELRSLYGSLIRRHQLMRHPREAGYHHAEGRPTRQENSRRLGGVRII